MPVAVSPNAILLPGVVLPQDLPYGALIEALGPDVGAHAKDLEVYATDEPPSDYGLALEIDGVLREADASGFERFHLVGYSAGGAIATALAARHPDRLLSLALLEPAWIGNDKISDDERRIWREFRELAGLPPDEMMLRFVRLQLAEGVAPPSPPPGRPPPWMAKRPAGIRAVTEEFTSYDLPSDRLRSFDRPVYFALGGLSNPDFHGRTAERAGELFEDFTLEVFAERHHFDPPHRAEPERLASSLQTLWRRAQQPVG